MIEEIKKILIKNLQKDIEENNYSFEIEYEIENKIKNIKKAEKLSELEIKLDEAIKLLQDNNVPVVLTEEDKKTVTETRKILSNKSDFVCVHKTDYMPENDRIRTAKETGVVSKIKKEIDGEKYEIEYEIERNTVHFCVNGEVTDNDGGSWNNCKYAIVLPLESIDSKQIKGAIPVDLYTKGSVNLNEDSWILCPKGESEKIKKQNKKINVIEYEGKNVSEYANAFIGYLGYEYIEGNNWCWYHDPKSQENFYDILEKEGVPLENLRCPHSGTIFSKSEDNKCNLNIENEQIKILKEQNKLNSIEDVINLKNSYCMDVDNTQFIQEMLEYFKQNGMNIPKSHEQILLSATKIKENVENGNKDEITDFFKELQTKSLNEKIINARIQTVLEELAETRGYGGKTYVKKLLGNLLQFSYLSQKEETRKIIYKKEKGRDIVDEKNYEKIKKQMIEMLDKEVLQYDRIRFRDSRGCHDDYFHYDSCFDILDRESHFFLSSPITQKQSYDVMLGPHKQLEKGTMYLVYTDDEKNRFSIFYDYEDDEMKFEMGRTEVLEDRFFDLIKDTPQKGEFQQFYFMLTQPNLYQIMDDFFPTKEIEKNKIGKKMREEAHKLTTKQLGKASINVDVMDKNRISQQIEKWKEKEEEKTLND